MEHTAKNFVLQLGSLIALYISLSAIATVAFGIINILFPDEVWSTWQYTGAQDQIRFGIALLIVFFPTYLILTRLVNKARRTAKGAYLTLTKWLIYLSLLVGGGILLGDFVAVIWTFLNGEITVRFILKALTLLVVIGTAFTYYILDAREYWKENESASKMYGLGATAIVIVLITLGFFNIETPQAVRDIQLDAQQVQDLDIIQWRVAEYYQLNGSLPETLNDVYDGVKQPTAPADREEYTYHVTGATQFELCATFVKESITNEFARPYVSSATDTIKNPYNWDHGTGRVCFSRSVGE